MKFNGQRSAGMPNQVSWYAIDTDIAEGMHFDAQGRLALHIEGDTN